MGRLVSTHHHPAVLHGGRSAREERLDFKVGDKVVYPNHGVGVIEQVTKQSIGDSISSFYRLRILSTDSTVMVPVGNTLAVGLRKVLTRREVTRVLGVLKNGEVATYDDWKGRFQANSEKMRTGDILAVAEVLKSLSVLSEVKPLSYRERKMLDRARFLLISELAEAANKGAIEVETQIDAALTECVKGAKGKLEH
jgi:CarD family transcriptional regulator